MKTALFLALILTGCATTTPAPITVCWKGQILMADYDTDMVIPTGESCK